MLQQTRIEAVTPKYIAFMHAFPTIAERIRFAAVEALAEQDDDSINELFEPFLSDESSDNRRIREVVVNAFVDKNWKVKDQELFMDGYVIPGVRIQKDGSVLRSR